MVRASRSSKSGQQCLMAQAQAQAHSVALNHMAIHRTFCQPLCGVVVQLGFCFSRSHPPSLPPLFTSVNNGCLDAWRGGSWLGGRDCWPWEYYSVKGQAGCLASRGSPPGTQPPFSDAVVNKSLASSSCPLDKLYNASSSQGCKPPAVCPSTQTQDPFRHLGGEGH